MAYIRGHHIVHSVIVTKRGSEDSRAGSRAFQRQLAVTSKYVTYLAPMDKILALIDGHTWEVLERRVNQVERVPTLQTLGSGWKPETTGLRKDCSCAAMGRPAKRNSTAQQKIRIFLMVII